MKFTRDCGIGFAAISLCAATSWGQSAYDVITIGTLGGPASSATALNNAGVVVGISSTSAASNTPRAFRWINGSIIDLGTLGGPSAEAFDVNDAGQITGRAETKDSIQFNETFHAFVWEDGSMIDLGTTGGQSSRGWAINNVGVVVGASQICWYDPKNPGGPCFPVGNEYAFVSDDGGSNDLGGLFGSSDSSALGVNSSNQVVGQSIVGGVSSPRHAVLWLDGQAIDLGTLGGLNSWAFDVNDAGLIAGFSDNASNTSHHPFIYDINGTGQLIDLGLPSGFTSAEAIAINNSGQLVGVAFNCCKAVAFVHDGKTMHDLNTLIPRDSGWTLTEASDINDAGWIIGHGLHNGAQRGFLLKPVIAGCGPDIDCNGIVDVDDLLALINSWGSCQSPCATDLTGNGIVDVDDLLVVINNWG